MSVHLGPIPREVWDRFLQKLAVKTWGEKEVISQGKKIVNLLGSAEKHFEVFKEAFEEVMADHLETNDTV